MNETLRCPGCDAELMLTAVANGQTVQCPRCAQVFEPGGRRAPLALNSAPPMRSAIDQETADEFDDDSPDESSVLDRPAPLRGERLATLAIVMLALCIFSYGVQIYFAYERMQLIQLVGFDREAQLEFMFHRGLGPPKDPRMQELRHRLERWEDGIIAATLLHHVVYWPTMMIFLAWMHRAYGNLRKLKAEGLSDVPGLAIISFFVPIQNLFHPYVIMQEIWRASDPSVIKAPLSVRKKSPLILFWWLSFLAACFLWGLKSLAEFNDLEQIVARIGITGYACMIAAGVLLIFIINGIRQRQRERYVRLYAGPA